MLLHSSRATLVGLQSSFSFVRAWTRVVSFDCVRLQKVLMASEETDLDSGKLTESDEPDLLRLLPEAGVQGLGRVVDFLLASLCHSFGADVLCV